MEQPLLRVENLSVRYVTPTGNVDALKKVSFELGREKLTFFRASTGPVGVT